MWWAGADGESDRWKLELVEVDRLDSGWVETGRRKLGMMKADRCKLVPVGVERMRIEADRSGSSNALQLVEADRGKLRLVEASKGWSKWIRREFESVESYLRISDDGKETEFSQVKYVCKLSFFVIPT